MISMSNPATEGTGAAVSSEFPHLFSPITVGSHVLPNRLVATAAGTSIVHEGVSLEGDHAHYARQARGGVGLIVTGAMMADPGGVSRSRFLVEPFSEHALPSLAKRADAVHAEGTKIFGQIAHLGRELLGLESVTWPVAPSPILSPRDVFRPRELEVEDIASIVRSFARSARNLEVAGYDGVELHGAHGYLIAQFMSRSANQRTDAYGGDLRNRFRFLQELIAAIRESCSADFALGVRMSAEEEIPDGIDTDEACRFAELLAETGAVDYVSVTHGVRGAYVKDGTHPDKVAAPSAARIREASGLTTLVAQRIRDPHTAEDVLRAGSADLVGMARGLLADPDLPRKAKEGRVSEIRTCLGINQDCRSFDEHLHCAVNAEVGRSSEVFTPAERPGTVYVVGGGPAGLEAARVAAERGHSVVLLERDRRLGGQLNAAAAAPHRGTLIDVVDYLARELKRLHVDVNLGAEIGLEDLTDIAGEADSIIVATGSSPILAPAEVGDAVTVEAVLDGTASVAPGASAIVFDEREGFWPAFSAAERLAVGGARVSFVTPAPGIGARIPHESLGPLLRRLDAGGVDLYPGHRLEAGGDGRVRLVAMVGGRATEAPADLVVWNAGRRSVDDLYRVGRHRVDVGMHVIGDAVSPRRIGHAILEGYRAGAAV
jgi:2,4-dienoyl-CoA reductase-like NADH-dependent reductase (Old Yellow Enzyme family)